MGNSPINNTDPTGHMRTECGGSREECGGYGSGENTNKKIDLKDYGITADPNQWDDDQQKSMAGQIDRIAQKMWFSYYQYCNQTCGYHDYFSLFRAIFGPLTITRDTLGGGSAWAGDLGYIRVHANGYPLSGMNIGLLTHEFGHKFDNKLASAGSNALIDEPLAFQYAVRGNDFDRSELGYQGNAKPFVYHFVGDPPDGPGEDFADEYYNWVNQGVQSGSVTLGFSDNDFGHARYNWIDNRMGAWIYRAAGG